MDEERPLKEAREALSQQEAAESTMISTLETKVSPTTSEYQAAGSAARSGPQMKLVIGGIALVVVVLILVGSFLPPFSLGQRLGLTGSEDALAGATLGGVDKEEKLSLPGEISLTIANNANGVNVDKITKEVFLNKSGGEEWTAAADAVPGSLTLASDIYTIAYSGDAPIGLADISIPASAQPHQTLDLYGWYSDNWRFIASSVDSDGGQLTSANGSLPQALALMQTAQPADPEVAAEVLPTQSLPAQILPHLTEMNVGTLTLGQNGTVLGDVVSVPDGGYQKLIRVTNTGAIVDTASLTTLLADVSLQEKHNETLLDKVQSGNYAGVNLDYQGVDTDQTAAFSAFVEGLAAALHEQNASLFVTLETPLQDGNGWNTDGQDWVAIGRVADGVYFQMPVEPTVYGDNEKAELLVIWAARQVERSKLTMLLNVEAVDGVGEVYRTVANDLALRNFGELQLVQGAQEVDPGDSVEVALTGSASALEWDAPSLSYKYTYDQAGQLHTVWLSSEALLSHRARFANRYHLRGIAMRGLGSLNEAAGYVLALQSYLGAANAPQPASAAIVWAVEDASGGVLVSESGESLAYAWEAGQEPGTYTIRAQFAQGDHVSNLGAIDISVIEPPEPTPTPEPEPTEEPEPTATPGTAVQQAQPQPVNPGSADAVANTQANVRSGPGLGYGISGALQTGQAVSLIGRNEQANWLQIETADGEQGWVFASLLSINSSISVSTLAVVEVDPPAGGTGTTAGGGGGGGGAPPPIIPPAGGGNFELGGQTHTLANPTLMGMSGMNWVKFQHKWGSGDSPSAVAGRIQQAQANGFKVLLSIPGSATYPGSIDFAGYVQFLGGVAALGPNAIEVWNEMNIDFEWPAGQIDPTSYVNNMLAPAYNAIKAANPSVMVVSGAPAPTGFDNGTNAWADNRYMAGVAAAGGGSYMDCIGVHHNAGATSPNATSGHPTGSAHYSWYFWPTLNMYYNAFGGSRPVCFTELGYLSGQDFGGVPERFSWAANTTVQQHAQWLAEAASLSANSGKVRLMIIFNVDFTLWSDDPQAGYAMLRPDGSCPSCALLGQVMGQ